MNNTPDQIEVITSNRFNLPPKKYLILLVILALIALGVYFYSQNSPKKLGLFPKQTDQQKKASSQAQPTVKFTTSSFQAVVKEINSQVLVVETGEGKQKTTINIPLDQNTKLTTQKANLADLKQGQKIEVTKIEVSDGTVSYRIDIH